MEREDFGHRLWHYHGVAGELIPLLQSAQEHFGYIPRRAIRHISEATGIPESTVYGVITFYSQFRLQPIGRHIVRVCAGTACHVSGSKMLIDSVQDELGIEVGETTADGIFTLFTVACLGCCSLSPVMMVDEETHGRLTTSSVRKILRGYRRRAQADAPPVAQTKADSAAGPRCG
ncbi:MAG: NADH-quinone oxidoreductase subunit NuoE [Candidatus Eisenbacteria bacterium]|nr:NADH-quinone oxidoreductase subunit NuoE [Candidatus Eisenbacteria bacterium]